MTTQYAFLVYQTGIANVFEVDSLNLADYGRCARRLLQADFRACEAFAAGLLAAGTSVGIASCNMAGDCTFTKWTSGTSATPFRDECRPPVGHAECLHDLIEDIA